MSEEDKPIPSGRPRPGIEPPKKKEEDEPREHTSRHNRSLVEVITADVRFWIFISGMLVGILMGLAF